MRKDISPIAEGVHWKTCWWALLELAWGVGILGVRSQGGRSMVGPQGVRAVSGL